MGLRETRYRSLLAVFVFLMATAVLLRPSPAAAGSVLPFPGTELTSAVKGVPTTGGLATVSRIAGHCPLIQCKIVGGVSIAFAMYGAYDAAVGAKQSFGSLVDMLGPQDSYPSSMNDGEVAATVTSVSGRSITMEITCASGWEHFSGTGTGEVFRCYPGLGVTGSIGVGQNNTTDKQIECKNTTTDATVVRPMSTGIWTIQNSYVASSGVPAPTKTVTNLCNTGEVVTGFALGASDLANPANSTLLQEAPIGWGTLAGSELPPGEVEFGAAVIQVDCKNAKTGATATMAKTTPWVDETLTIPSCKAKYGEDWYGTGLRIIPQDPKINGEDLPAGIWPGWQDPTVPKEEWAPGGVTPEISAMPCYSSPSGCSLTVWIDGEPVFPGEFSWSKISAYEEDARATCRWGTQTVPWDNCKVLKGAFDSPSGQAEIDPYKPPVVEPGVVNPTVPEGVPAPETPVTPSTPTDIQDFGACMAGVTGWNPFTYVYAGTKCALRWAFVPNPASWGWPQFVAQVQARPPTSIALGLVTQMQAVASGFQSSGSCGVIADFGDDMAITCPAIQSIPGFSALYGIVQVALVGLTGFTIFHMFRSVLGSEGS